MLLFVLHQGNHKNLPFQLLCIADSRSSPAAPLLVVDGKKSGGMIYHKVIALQHTVFVKAPADINDGIRLF